MPFHKTKLILESVMIRPLQDSRALILVVGGTYISECGYTYAVSLTVPAPLSLSFHLASYHNVFLIQTSRVFQLCGIPCLLLAVSSNGMVSQRYHLEV